MLGNNIKNTNKVSFFIIIPFKNSNLSITESDHGINAFSGGEQPQLKIASYFKFLLLHFFLR